MNAERNHLEEKVNMLEFCINSIPDAVHWVALDGRFWDVNAAACGMLGYSRDELLSLSVHDIDPDYSHESMQSDLELLKRAGTLSLRRSHTAKDGRIIPVEIMSNYLTYNDVEYICCIVRDITERVKAEKEAAFLRTLIEYTRDPVYVVNHTRGSRQIYVNDAACIHYGRPREELMTMRTFDLDATLDKQDIDKLHEELKQKKSLRFETIHQVASGNMVPVEVTANYLELDGEELAVGFFHDISRRKAMEAELHQAHEELEKSIEERTTELARTTDALKASEQEKSLILNVTDALFVYYDTEMNILWANKVAGDSVNMTPEELQKRHCWEVWHQRQEPCIGCPVLRARDTEQPQEAETRSPDGRAWFIRGFPVKNVTGRLIGMVEFCQDFTERKQMEESLWKAHDELESKVRERTEQLTSLTAELSLAEERERRRIATELHDQVGQTLIFSKIKLDSLSLSLPSESFEKQRGEIKKYLDQSIQDIRSLTFQLSPPLLYEVGFEAAVEWLGEELEGKYGFQVEFQDDGRKKLLAEEASVALYQMVRELLLNVAKHANAKRVRISVSKVSGKIKVIVADDGLGFDSLKGMRRKNKKNGFGLFNIRQRIEYLGGELLIESEIGQGTRATLLLPLKKKVMNRKIP